MDYNVICDPPYDIVTHEPFDDTKDDVIVIFFPVRDKSFCFMATDLFKVRRENQVNLWLPGTNRMPSVLTRPVFKIPYMDVRVDKSLVTGIENGHTIFYLYPSYVSEIGSSIGVSHLHGSEDYKIYSAIPIPRETFLSTSLPELQRSLLPFTPSVVNKERIRTLYEREVVLEKEWVRNELLERERSVQAEEDNRDVFNDMEGVEENNLSNRRQRLTDEFITACHNGNLENVRRLIVSGVDPAARDNRGLLAAVVGNRVGVVNYLLQNPDVNPAAQNNQAFVIASGNGFLEIMNILLGDSRVNPTDQRNQAIITAASNGKIDAVNELLKFKNSPLASSPIGHEPRVRGHYVIDPSDQNNKAIISAAEHGHDAIVQLLLRTAKVNPAANSNEALIRASARGHLNVVKTLLSINFVDPSDKNNEAIISASAHGKEDVVDFLLQDPRVNPADKQNQAIILASAGGHLNVIKRLMKDPRVNPFDKKNKAVILAIRNNFRSVYTQLLSDSRANIKEIVGVLKVNGVSSDVIARIRGMIS